MTLQEELELLRKENESLKAELQSNIYKKFFHLSPDILIMVDKDYRYEYIHMPGVPQANLDRLKGADLISTTPEGFRERMSLALKKVFENKETEIYESFGPVLGSDKYFINYLTPILDENNEVQYAYFVSRDITAQKKSEIQVSLIQQTLNSLFYNMQNIYMVFDLNFDIIWYNHRAEVYAAKIFNQILTKGISYKDFMPPHIIASVMPMMERCKEGETFSYQRTYDFDDNKKITFALSFQPIYENNKITAIANIGIDITDIIANEEKFKKINNELVLQNNQLNQYSHIISHNLRSPISTLMGIVNVIELYKNDEKLRDDLLSQIKSTALKLDTIIQDLNVIIHQTHNEVNVRQPIDLNELVQSVCDLTIQPSMKSSIHVYADFNELPILYSIKGYLHSIFYNLISNSIKYRKQNEDCIIKIQLKNLGSKVEINFRDNGIGIDLDQYRDKMFGFYKRFHSHIEGKGIGLHLTKTQIELMGGKIDVESTVGLGTSFTIVLPIQE